MMGLKTLGKCDQSFPPMSKWMRYSKECIRISDTIRIQKNANKVEDSFIL